MIIITALFSRMEIDLHCIVYELSSVLSYSNINNSVLFIPLVSDSIKIYIDCNGRLSRPDVLYW